MANERWRNHKELSDPGLGLPSPEPREPDSELAANSGATMDFSLVPGQVLAGRYEIRRAIGRGGMGEVYESHDRLLNESVALKTLRPDLVRDPALVRHFQREVQLTRKVTHPNVCRLFEMGLEEGGPDQPPLPFFTMELLKGETLAARIRRVRRLSVREALGIALQLTEGLQAAHDAGIVHADFKSGNVILTPAANGERAVITDFGLSFVPFTNAPAEETRSMSAEGQLIGTLSYMSPEQLVGGHTTAASDIYSLGIVLFEMVTGQLPFDTRHAIRGAVQRVAGGSITARLVVPNLDLRWDAAISRCLQKEPERRFPSPRAVGEYLVERGRSWKRREWIQAGTGAGITLAAAGGFWVWSHRPYRPRAGALAWYVKGVAALHSMTYETARRAFEEAATEDPGFALAHAGLARAYDELDYTELAKESMLRGMSAAQDSHLSGPDRRKVRAAQFLVSRDYDRAAPLLGQMESDAPRQEKAAAALECGWLAQQRADSEGAIKHYQLALTLDPAYAAAKLRLGYILGRRAQTDAALKTLGEAEALYKASSNYEGVTQTLYEQARILNLSSRPAEAMAIINKALPIAHTTSNPYQEISLQLLQGVAARNLGDSRRAAEIAQQAIDAALLRKMDNLAANGLIDLGNSYLAAGDQRSAEPFLRRAIEVAGRGKIRRNEARARLALGSLCEQSHRPNEARQFIELALPFYRQAGYRREFIQAMTLLGGVLQQQAEFEEGIRVLREALATAVQVHDNRLEGLVRERLGNNLRDQGAWPDALKEFESAASLLGPRGPGAQVSCAEMYGRLGRRTEAEKRLSNVEKLLKQSPNQERLLELQTTRGMLAYQDGRFTEAAAFAAQAVDGAPAGASGSNLPAQLLQRLVDLRRRPGNPDLDAAATVIENFQRTGLVFEAASARLQIAEAIMSADNASPSARQAALRLATEAQGFFEPRHIWESLWRAHWAAARASSNSADREAHRAAALSALGKLKALWPLEMIEPYMSRRDVRRLSSSMQ